MDGMRTKTKRSKNKRLGTRNGTFPKSLWIHLMNSSGEELMVYVCKGNVKLRVIQEKPSVPFFGYILNIKILSSSDKTGSKATSALIFFFLVFFQGF